MKRQQTEHSYIQHPVLQIRIYSIIMRIRIRDPKNVHMDPYLDPDADPYPRGYRLKKKNYIKFFLTKYFKMTLKNHRKINKQNIILSITKGCLLTFDLPVLYSPQESVHFLGFFTSWIWIHICPWGSGSDGTF